MIIKRTKLNVVLGILCFILLTQVVLAENIATLYFSLVSMLIFFLFPIHALFAMINVIILVKGGYRDWWFMLFNVVVGLPIIGFESFIFYICFQAAESSWLLFIPLFFFSLVLVCSFLNIIHILYTSADSFSKPYLLSLNLIVFAISFMTGFMYSLVFGLL